MKLKDKIVKNRVGILIFIGVLLVVTIIIGISYAYFFNIEIKNNNTISGNINTKYYTFATSGNKTISIALEQDKLNIAEGSNNYTSFISNTGGNITIFLAAINGKKVYCTYDLVYVPSTAYVPSTEAKNVGLKELTLSGTTAAGYKFDDVDISGSNTVTLMKNALISTNGQYGHGWNFTVKYYNLNVIQDNVIGKTFGGNIKVANVDCSFNEPILGGNYVLLKSTGASSITEAKSQIESYGTPDFSTATTETEKGMFSAPDDLGTSYYFRGAVNNNWVKYGKYAKDMYNCNNGILSETDTGNSCTKIVSKGDEIYWRIIRINGDGSIRMIYSGVTPPTESTSVLMLENTSLGSSIFTGDYTTAETAGYNYSSGQHSNGIDSEIKTFIDKWFKDYINLNNNSQISNSIFCVDRTISLSSQAYSTENYTTLTNWDSTHGDYFYGAYGRNLVTPVSPYLTCPKSQDMFTTKLSNKGNNVLDYPAGLITADEITLAGAAGADGNSIFYLFTGEDYWTISPGIYNFQNPQNYNLDSSGSLITKKVTSVASVRPVISLISSSELSGNGTYDDVYTVVE